MAAEARAKQLRKLMREEREQSSASSAPSSSSSSSAVGSIHPNKKLKTNAMGGGGGGGGGGGAAATASSNKQPPKLARYNADGHLVCKLCNETVKSESLWETHCMGRKHKQALLAVKQKLSQQQQQQGRSSDADDVVAPAVPTPTPAAPSAVNAAVPANFFQTPLPRPPTAAKIAPQESAPASPEPADDDMTEETESERRARRLKEFAALERELEQEESLKTAPPPVQQVAPQNAPAAVESGTVLPEGFFQSGGASGSRPSAAALASAVSEVTAPRPDFSREMEEFDAAISATVENTREEILRIRKKIAISRKHEEHYEQKDLQTRVGSIKEKNLEFKRKLEEKRKAKALKQKEKSKTDEFAQSTPVDDVLDSVLDWRAKNI